MSYTVRLERLKVLMLKRGIKALLITKPENIYYLSGLFATSAALIIAPDKQLLLSDSRYFLQAKQVSDFEPIMVKSSLTRSVGKIADKLGISQLFFEEHFISYENYEELRRTIKLKKSGKLVEHLRLIKDKEEIDNIKKACLILTGAVREISRQVAPNITESQLARHLDCLIMERGADGSAFPTIVATGKNSAAPHYETGNTKVREGDFVLIDAGATCNHYHSDMTRTFVAGKASEKQKQMLDLAKKAQKKAIDKISKGKKAFEIDKSARDLISREGYGNAFCHNLGHGVGLEVHEGPVLEPKGKTVLTEGMVFSVEPGIYIENLGGVRIENTVLITEKGAELLTGIDG